MWKLSVFKTEEGNTAHLPPSVSPQFDFLLKWSSFRCLIATHGPDEHNRPLCSCLVIRISCIVLIGEFIFLLLRTEMQRQKTVGNKTTRLHLNRFQHKVQTINTRKKTIFIHRIKTPFTN